MLQDLQAAIPLGFILAFLLGPVFFVLLETAALKGIRAAIALDIGVLFSDMVFIVIAYFSTSQLLEKIKDEPGLFVFGGFLLISFGIYSIFDNKRTYQKRRNIEVELINKSNYITLFIKGFFLNFINIGVLIFWLTIIIAVGPQLEMDRTRIIFFFLAVLATYFSVDILKIILAKKLNERLTPKRIYLVKRFINLVIICFGVVLVSKGVFPNEVDQLQKEIEAIGPTKLKTPY